jgi:hypothetical protein
MDLNRNGIKSVSTYTASPVETCDRCGQGIKYVALVAYHDGTTQRYGMDCINKILATAPTLKTLFAKNVKRLKQLNGYLAILEAPLCDAPRGHEYFGSGLYFIADADGKDIMVDTHMIWHPVADREKNADSQYPVKDWDARLANEAKSIAKDITSIKAEVVRIEAFLGKILRSVK